MTANSLKESIKKSFEDISLEARELYLGNHVSICDYSPTALQFHRNWVSKNIPCIFKDAIHYWPAVKKWNHSYLREKLGSKEITVAVTPNGLADAITDGKFVLPEERVMKMNDFLDVYSSDSVKDSFYIQKQNSNMIEEFSELMVDIEFNIPWASEAFNKNPDAINFWMGSSKAVTSLHKDHYENIYCVVKGEKHFILYPPTDRPFIPYKNYSVAQFEFVGSTWNIKDKMAVGSSSTVPWIMVDPLNPRYDLYPEFKNAFPITCSVKSGDILYLPSLWFHHVRQTNGTIAVNYWYDMDYDAKYSFYQTLDKLSKLLYS